MNTNILTGDGGWAAWTTWSACSTTCGNGTQTRARTCSDPAPTACGENCNGLDNQKQICSLAPCPSAYFYTNAVSVKILFRLV